MAERVGFEPTLEFPLTTLCKRAPSATRPSLRRAQLTVLDYSESIPDLRCRSEFRIQVVIAPNGRIAAEGWCDQKNNVVTGKEKTECPDRACANARSGHRKQQLTCRREYPFKAVFVDHSGHGLVSLLVQRTHDASGAVDQNIGVGPQAPRRQSNAEADHRAHIKRGFGVKQHAAGGDIRGLGEVFARICGAYRKRQLEGEAD